MDEAPDAGSNALGEGGGGQHEGLGGGEAAAGQELAVKAAESDSKPKATPEAAKDSAPQDGAAPAEALMIDEPKPADETKPAEVEAKPAEESKPADESQVEQAMSEARTRTSAWTRIMTSPSGWTRCCTRAWRSATSCSARGAT